MFVAFSLMTSQLKQKEVVELLARADQQANENRSYQEVYTAMAESLREAWNDLNSQLEYRKMLLDQSIAFHESAVQVERSQIKTMTFYLVLCMYEEITYCLPQKLCT